MEEVNFLWYNDFRKFGFGEEDDDDDVVVERVRVFDDWKDDNFVGVGNKKFIFCG